MCRKRLAGLMAVTAAFLFVSGFSATCWAQDIEMPTESVAKEVPEGKGIYAIGLGATTAPEYEGSDDNQFYLLPYVSLRFENHMSVDLIANTLKANLIPSPTFRLGPIAQYIGERDNVDNNKVDKLEKVDAAFMLGGFAELEVNNFIASSRP
jgi:MipA family protein